MQTNAYKSAAILGVFVLLGMMVLGYWLSQTALQIKSLERTVKVKGLAEREVEADTVIWPISFQVASNEITDLYKLIKDNSQLISAYLREHGVSADEITSNPPVVNDLYARNYGDRGDVKFRYTGLSTLTVYSKDVAKVRRAISELVQLGQQGIVLAAGDYQNRTQFLYSGLNYIKPEMVEQATKNAREVAQKFAQDSSSVLGKIRSANQGQFSISDRDSTTPYIKKVRVVSTVEYYLSD